MRNISFLVLLTLAACVPESEAPKALPIVEPALEVEKPTPAVVESAALPVAEKKSVEAGPLGIMAPEEWIKEKPSNNMRKGQYRIPDKQKVAGDAALAIFHFSFASPLQANIERWQGQMGGAEAKTEEIKGALKITLVDMEGT